MAANVKGSIAAIPTTYAGNAFRSRLEAKWAVFFDRIGWRWTYEPFDLAGYIPDFLVHGRNPFLVEVGPVSTWDEYEDKSLKWARSGSDYPLLVVGVSPVGPDGSVGLWLGDQAWGMTGRDAAGELAYCKGYTDTCESVPERCGAIAVYSRLGSFGCYPCGHHDGDHHLGHEIPELALELWGEAGATVQWQPT